MPFSALPTIWSNAASASPRASPCSFCANRHHCSRLMRDSGDALGIEEPEPSSSPLEEPSRMRSRALHDSGGAFAFSSSWAFVFSSSWTLDFLSDW
eukprot:7202830-Prymnesium_polylepis.1